MNKKEFVELISKKVDLPKSKCILFLNETRSLILEVCSKGESVSIRDFGKFSLQEKKARRFLNPQTNRYYICKSKKSVNFKGAKSFKYALNF